MSTPLTWEEVEAGGVRPEEFHPRAVLARLSERGDPMAGLLTAGYRLPAI